MPPLVPSSIPGVNNFAQVSPILYRGEQPTALGMRELQSRGIKTIINLRHFHSDRPALKGTQLHHLHITCTTWLPREKDVITFLKAVSNPALHPVFVHCWQGCDRTGLMVLAYRLICQNWPLQDALEELPRFGFHPIWKRLHKYIRGFNVQRIQSKLARAKPPKIKRPRHKPA